MSIPLVEVSRLDFLRLLENSGLKRSAALDIYNHFHTSLFSKVLDLQIAGDFVLSLLMTEIPRDYEERIKPGGRTCIHNEVPSLWTETTEDKKHSIRGALLMFIDEYYTNHLKQYGVQYMAHLLVTQKTKAKSEEPGGTYSVFYHALLTSTYPVQ